MANTLLDHSINLESFVKDRDFFNGLLNTPSRIAAQRLGFSFEGIFRQAGFVKGHNRDTAWYAIMDFEWPAVRNAMQTWLHPENFDSDGNQNYSDCQK
jgi:hypothetical protein